MNANANEQKEVVAKATEFARSELAKMTQTGAGVFSLKDGYTVNHTIAKLPKARDYGIQTVSGKEIPNFKAIEVEHDGKTEFVYCPTRQYTIVQHEDAFRPIIEGMTLAGVKDFKYVLKHNTRWAKLQVYVGQAGYDSVSIGFEVTNSFDGSANVNFGASLNHTKKYIELVGYRQVCSNGMKIRVPLENAEIIKPEVVTQIKSLFSQNMKLKHTKNVSQKIATIQYMVEALTLLRDPVENMIKAGQEFGLFTKNQIEFLVKKHIGQRYAKKILEGFQSEEPNLWGLYNAVTYFASHDKDLKPVSRENLLDKASALLAEAVL